MKSKLIITIIGLLLSLFVVQSADFYTVYNVDFTHERPNSVYVTGGECTSTACQSVNQNKVEIFHGSQAISCMDAAKQHGNVEQFNSCMAGAKAQGGIVSLSGNSQIVVRTTTPTSFGYLLYFSTSGDGYIPKYEKTPFYTCEFDICFNQNQRSFTFEKKAEGIAEVGRVNIKNLDNERLPVQVEIPVKIEQTVCSAYRLAQPNFWLPNFPAGYSDYSADTQIRLSITRESTGQRLLQESVMIPIRADTCAGLAAFSWTPSSNLQNEQIKFRIETDVVDKQVLNSITDWAEVTETIYPENLNNVCWVRAYDFMLSNVANPSLTTSIAQITQGETLYANFRGGAYRDESMTPMNYEARVLFNGQLVETRTLSSSSNLAYHSFDLSSKIRNLQPGTYTVSLITTPIGSNCNMIEPVTQTQQLVLLAPQTFKVTFHVQDQNANPVNGANVNLNLIEADEYFQVQPTYSLTQRTNTNGQTVFTGAYRGDYEYTVSSQDYSSVSNSIRIGSDMDIYVQLNTNVEDNFEPIINLLEEFSVYYLENIEFDIRNYVQDYNDAFSALTIEYELISGNVNVNYNSPNFRISSTSPQDAQLRIKVTDPQGASAVDTTTLRFIDNSAPVVRDFRATPTDGAAPLQTRFTIDVVDADNDPLTCTINFGDNSAPVTDLCSNLNGMSYTFENIGTYKVELEVEDGVSQTVKASTFVYVFEREYSSPHINYFDVESSNNFNVPNDVTVSWDVSHPDGLNMNCNLRINGVSHFVNCNEGTHQINDWTLEGNSRFVLTAIDSEGHQVFRELTVTFGRYEEPLRIDYFVASQTSGNAPLPVLFESSIIGEGSEFATCSLNFGNGNVIGGNCNTLTEYSFTYYSAGTFPATLSIDGTSEEQTIMINVIDQTNTAPVIDLFQATPTSGIEPLDVLFEIQVSDEQDDLLTCTVEFGDGSIVGGLCSMFNSVENTYTQAGNYNALLRVSDGEFEVYAYQTINVISQEEAEPQITSFDVTSSTNFVVPTNLQAVWNVIHPQGLDMNCTLSYLGTTQQVDCNSNSYDINNFNQTGDIMFTLRVVDSDGNEVFSSISKTLYAPEEVVLDPAKVNLIMNETIVPGQFEFSIRVFDETLNIRQMDFKPVIVCQGVENTLNDNNGFIRTSAISQRDGVDYFTLTANTNDYRLVVPTDEICTFRLELVDEYGQVLNLSKFVTFAYPVPEQQLLSIRGFGTDMTNFMESLVTGGGLKPGFNLVKLNVVNNELEAKQISVSLISADLSLSLNERINLGPGQTQTVNMAISLDENANAGMYPVRLTVNDGDVRQTKYTYILIE